MKLITNVTLLLFVILVILNLTLIQDGPGALQHYIQDEYKVSTYMFSLLYIFSTLPGTFAFILGYFIERYDGLNKNTVISVAVVNTSCLLYAFGCYAKKYWIILIGRLIFGISFTGMVQSVNCYKLLCFRGERIVSVAFALSNSVPWLGSSVVFFISNRLQMFAAKYTTPINALNIAYIGPCLISSVFASIFLLLIMWMYKNIYSDPSPITKSDSVKEIKSVSLRNVLKAPLIFWLLVIAGFYGYSIIVNLIMMSQDLFIKGYNMNVKDSSDLSSLLCILICLFSPLAGYAVSILGRNLTFAAIGGLLSTLSHALFSFTSLNPVWPVVTLALSYAFTAASVWPVIDFIVKKEHISRACGIAQSVLCCFMTVGAMLAGYIIDNYGYRGLELIYFITNASVMPLFLVIWIIDIKNDSLLNMSSANRRKFLDIDY